MLSVATFGVGIQANGTGQTLLPELERIGAKFDYAEIFCDAFTGAGDSSYVLDPGALEKLDELKSKYRLIGHGNYGEEFGFGPIEESPAVRKHKRVIDEIGAPWYSGHLVYGSMPDSYKWSAPLQHSKAEMIRSSERAKALQDIYGIPVLHENIFYYAPFPGSTMPEAEFFAGLVDRAGTYILLDLHNIHAISVNRPDFDPWAYLRTIPLDRVLEIQIAGGQWIESWYHDLHNNSIPGGVWELLAHVMRNAANLRAVTLEYEGPAHSSLSREVDSTWAEMIKTDLDRASSLWASIRGPVR